MVVLTKDRTEIAGADFAKGEVILMDKPLGKSSFHVVHQVRKYAGVKKVGHAGTLDPLATGLLIICTGKKTKEIEKFQGLKKTYTGSITLGKCTSSMDSETPFTEEKGIDGISEEMIYSVRDTFLGENLQLPPMYSAVKFKGKSLYKYARKGVEIKREPKNVTVYDFQITKIELPEVYFEITCSKGTYIRVISDDFGRRLGCGGYLSSLRRTRIGEYSVEDAFSVDEFANVFISAGNNVY